MTEPAASAPIKHPDRFFIDGSWAAPSSAAKIDVINSGTEQLFVRVAEAQAADVDRAVAAARSAFDRGPWPRLSHAERAKYLRAIARELALRADDLAQIWTTESGVIHGIAKGGSLGLGSIYEYYAGLADTFPFEEERKPGLGSGNVRAPRARAGRRRRGDHPVERAGVADRLQVRARAARGLHGDPQGFARGPWRGATCSPRSCEADRAPGRRAQRPHREPRGLGAARPPPRRRQGDLHRLDGGGAARSRRSAASASRAARSSSAASRRP